MILCYTGAALVTPSGIRHEPLVIDTRRGRILPSRDASRAHRIIDAGDWALYPGLVNAHDHLEFNHYPRTRWRERYPNASLWASDMQPHLDEQPFLTLRNLPLEDRCLVGGLKNLFSGVTTVAHHNALHKPLKNKHFPVRVLRRYSWAHSLYLTPEADIKRAHRNSHLFMIHLAEGTDDAANDELTQLAKMGCLDDKTVLIHGVGLRGDNLQQAVDSNRGLVWCPSSNFFLLGQTAQVDIWHAAGKLALGSDSRLTADGDLLDELKTAREFMDAESLFHLVTDAPARMLRLDDAGDLQPGMRADVFALPRSADGDYYRHLVNVHRADIVWVMRGGQLLWQQTNTNANCTLDGVSYHLHEAILRIVKRSSTLELRLVIHR